MVGEKAPWGVYRHAAPSLSCRRRNEIPHTPRRAAVRCSRLALYLWCELPAFMTGFSMRPPPAMMPTMARQSLEMVFLDPLGMRTLVVCASSLWPMMVTYSPLHLAILPRSAG